MTAEQRHKLYLSVVQALREGAFGWPYLFFLFEYLSEDQENDKRNKGQKSSVIAKEARSLFLEHPKSTDLFAELRLNYCVGFVSYFIARTPTQPPEYETILAQTEAQEAAQFLELRGLTYLQQARQFAANSYNTELVEHYAEQAVLLFKRLIAQDKTKVDLLAAAYAWAAQDDKALFYYEEAKKFKNIPSMIEYAMFCLSRFNNIDKAISLHDEILELVKEQKLLVDGWKEFIVDCCAKLQQIIISYLINEELYDKNGIRKENFSYPERILDWLCLNIEALAAKYSPRFSQKELKDYLFLLSAVVEHSVEKNKPGAASLREISAWARNHYMARSYYDKAVFYLKGCAVNEAISLHDKMLKLIEQQKSPLKGCREFIVDCYTKLQNEIITYLVNENRKGAGNLSRPEQTLNWLGRNFSALDTAYLPSFSQEQQKNYFLLFGVARERRIALSSASAPGQR